MRYRIVLIGIMLLAIAFSTTQAARANCDINWITDSDGVWGDGANWDLGRAPAAGESVCIDVAENSVVVTVNATTQTVTSVAAEETIRITNGGSLLTTSDGTSTLNGGVVLESGALNGGIFELRGESSWSGAANANQINNHGTLAFTADATINSWTTLDNFGIVTHAAGSLIPGNHGRVTNHEGATWIVDGPATYNFSLFVNEGTLQKTGDGLLDLQTTEFSQNGQLTVTGGEALWKNGTALDASYTVGAGALLTLDADNTIDWYGTQTGSGDGRIQIVDGYVTGGHSDQPATILSFPAGLFHLTGGVLNGRNCSGDHPCAETLVNQGTIQISGEGDKWIYGELHNWGRVIHRAGTANLGYLGNHGSFYNRSDGILLFDGSAAWAGRTFYNEGTVAQQADETVAFNAPLAVDGGTFDIQAGTFAIEQSATLKDVTYTVAPGARLTLGKNRITFSGEQIGSGGGRIEFGNVNGNFATGNDGVSPVFRFPPGMFHWIGGIFTAGSEVDPFVNEGTIHLAGSATKEDRGYMVNRGTIEHEDDGPFEIFASATFRNEGTYLLKSDADITRRSYPTSSDGDALFDNAGLLLKDGTFGTSEMPEVGRSTSVFSNTGTVEVRTGDLVIGRSLPQVSDDTLTGGTWRVHDQASLLLNRPGKDVTIIDATVTLNGAGVAFSAVEALTANRGTLQVESGAVITTPGDFVNTGTLVFGIGGSAASGIYGRIAVSGTATLSGTLGVTLTNGFGPSAGDSYTVMTYADRQNSFDATTGTAPFFTPIVDSDSVRLVVAGSAGDIVASAVTVQGWTEGTSLAPGTELTINYRVRNGSIEPLSGGWRDSLYLSTDDVFDINDTLLARVPRSGDLAAQGEYEETVRATVPALPTAPYRVLLMADSSMAVPDVDRSNNQLASAETVSVIIPTLPYDMPVTVNLLPDEDVYYHLPVSGDEWVVVSAEFESDAQGELFAKLNLPPTPSDYLFAAANLYQRSRSIEIAPAFMGNHYLLLHGREGADSSRTVTLTARELPVALTEFMPDRAGAETGVTLELAGLNLSADTSVELLTGATVVASATQVLSPDVTNNRLAFATFDLQGLSPGSYQVRVTKPSGASATGAQPLTVVAPQVEQGFYYRLVGPGRLRANRPYRFILEYGNEGLRDVVAPWLTVSHSTEGTWQFADGTPIEGQTIDLLATSSKGDPTILRPGQRETIEFVAQIDVGAPVLQVWIADEQQQMTVEEMVVLAGGDADEAPWHAVVPALVQRFGDTHGAYLAALYDIVQDEAANGRRIHTIDRLLQRAVIDALFATGQIRVQRVQQASTEQCSGRTYATDARFNGGGNRLADGRWIPPGLPAREPTPFEMAIYETETRLRAFAVGTYFLSRDEWEAWIDLWLAGSGEPWMAGADTPIAKEMFLDLVQKGDIDRLSLWADIGTMIETEQAPFNDIPFGEGQVALTPHRNAFVEFADYTLPKPGEVRWSFGANYVYYPMELSGEYQPLDVFTDRLDAEEVGSVVHWQVRDMPMRVTDEFNIDEHTVNQQAHTYDPETGKYTSASKDGPMSFFYIPFYMVQTFGDARCMKWIVELRLPEYSGTATIAGVKTDAGPRRVIQLQKGQETATVTLRGSAEAVRTILVNEAADNKKPFVWSGFPVSPADTQNPTLTLHPGDYVFVLKATAKYRTPDNPNNPVYYSDVDSTSVTILPYEEEEEPKRGKCSSPPPPPELEEMGYMSSTTRTCPKPPPPLRPGFVSSFDPNDIVGPSGVGEEHYTRRAELYPYTIYFENLASATAPAQEVVVTHHLSDKLDWSSFELGDFGFGDWTFDVPAGRTYHRELLDLREPLTLMVEFEAGLDVESGVVSWTFRSIDPETGDLTGDALAGFLPPNVDGPEGEGFVRFTARLRADLASGAAIDAQARIVFDTNEPIDTPIYGNLIDETSPTSSVNALAESTSSPFTVSWSGIDDGSGVAAYAIYVSENDGPWQHWRTVPGTTTSATYSGTVGRRYAFFSVATDGVGLSEEKILAAETSTTVISQVAEDIYLPLITMEQNLIAREQDPTRILVEEGFYLPLIMGPR